MRKYFVIGILIICMQSVATQNNDTIYYDTNWKGVQVKNLATFMRVVYSPMNYQNSKTVKDFYITGELQSEGYIPVYIDKLDDKKSKFKGHCITYYKSGQKQFDIYRNDSCQLEGELKSYYENGNLKRIVYLDHNLLPEAVDYDEKGIKLSKGTIKDGQFEGEFTNYYENGLRKSKGILKNGKWQGTFYQFNTDGSYTEIEMIDGECKNNYYTFVHVDGKRTKMKNDNLKTKK